MKRGRRPSRPKFLDETGGSESTDDEDDCAAAAANAPRRVRIFYAIANQWPGEVVTINEGGWAERAVSRVCYDIGLGKPSNAEEVTIELVCRGGLDAQGPFDFTVFQGPLPAGGRHPEKQVPAPVQGMRSSRNGWCALFGAMHIWEAFAWTLCWDAVGAPPPLPCNAPAARAWFKTASRTDPKRLVRDRLAALSTMDGPSLRTEVEIGLSKRIRIGGLNLFWPGLSWTDVGDLAQATGGVRMVGVLSRLFSTRPLGDHSSWWSGLPDVIAFQTPARRISFSSTSRRSSTASVNSSFGGGSVSPTLPGVTSSGGVSPAQVEVPLRSTTATTSSSSSSTSGSQSSDSSSAATALQSTSSSSCADFGSSSSAAPVSSTATQVSSTPVPVLRPSVHALSNTAAAAAASNIGSNSGSSNSNGSCSVDSVSRPAAPRVVWLEAKSHSDTLKDEQKEWLRYAANLGFEAGVVYVKKP